MKLFLFFLLLFPTMAFAGEESPPARRALILCFDSDDLMRRFCNNIRVALFRNPQCEMKPEDVVSLSYSMMEKTYPTASPAERVKLTIRDKGWDQWADLPVFVVGHGGESKDGKHEIALSKPEQSILTSDLIRSLKDPPKEEESPLLVTPSIYVAPCQGGKVCQELKGCIGAACAENELTWFEEIHEPFDPVTAQTLKLLCQKDLFQDSQTKELVRLTGEKLNDKVCKSFRPMIIGKIFLTDKELEESDLLKEAKANDHLTKTRHLKDGAVLLEVYSKAENRDECFHRFSEVFYHEEKMSVISVIKTTPQLKGLSYAWYPRKIKKPEATAAVPGTKHR